MPRLSAPFTTYGVVHQIHYSNTEGKRILEKFERSDNLFFRLARDSKDANKRIYKSVATQSFVRQGASLVRYEHKKLKRYDEKL